MGLASALARFGRRLLAALALLPLLPLAPAYADGACSDVVARTKPLLVPAAFRPTLAAEEAQVGLSFLGHASFLIESPGGVAIVTDYNGFIKPRLHPRYRDDEPRPFHALHRFPRARDQVGAARLGSGGGVPHHDLPFGDVHIRNVPTNIRDFGGGTEFGGNSIFVFEIADLCIAHLSHLHHTLTPEHLAELGQIDVLLAPVDGTYTLSQRT